MSLINEALKKAQRQRTADPVAVPAPVPGTAEAPVARIAKRRPPMPARTLVILIGGSVSLLLMAGLVTVLFWDSAPPAPPRPPKPVVADTPKPAPPDSPIAVTPVAPVTPVTSVVPATPPEPVITVKLPPVTIPPPEPPPQPVVVIPPEPSPPVAPPPTVPVMRAPVANPRVYQFLETLRVAGIRVSDTDPKVIMNDRVFRLNDLVDRTLQLRLIRVNSSSLTFADASGFEYEKSF